MEGVQIFSYKDIFNCKNYDCNFSYEYFFCAGTSRIVKAREKESMYVNGEQKAIDRGMPPRGAKREAPGPGRHPGAPVRAGQAEQAHGLERVPSQPGSGVSRSSPVPLEARGEAADRDQEAQGGCGHSAGAVPDHGEAD